MENNSKIVFLLQGINETQTNRHMYFTFTLTLYLFTIFANLILIFTIFLERMLHEPMYIFLFNLCINGIYGASCFYPKLLHDLLAEAHVISYAGCLTQVFFIYGYVFCEFTNLTMMAYDRYIAICKPLQYHTIMTVQKVGRLLVLTWIFAHSEVLIGIMLTIILPLCGDQIDKLYCTNWAVVKLSCTDNTLNNIYGFVLTMSHLFQTMLILVSYINIVKTSLRSKAGRRKFMQTCLPHLITLSTFTTTLVFDIMYARYGQSGDHQILRNIISAEFLVVPPLINPIIYGMTLHQIRKGVVKMFSHKVNALR